MVMSRIVSDIDKIKLIQNQNIKDMNIKTIKYLKFP